MWKSAWHQVAQPRRVENGLEKRGACRILNSNGALLSVCAHSASAAASMMGRTSKPMRVKGALALALLYALCVLAPVTAIAFMDSARAAHCLTEMHGAAPAHMEQTHAHTHASGTAHAHDDRNVPQSRSDSDASAQPEQCCGLFCITALAIEPGAGLAHLVAFSTVAPAAAQALGGRGPERIIRPPIA
jgi:hypothetical protein